MAPRAHEEHRAVPEQARKLVGGAGRWARQSPARREELPDRAVLVPDPRRRRVDARGGDEGRAVRAARRRDPRARRVARDVAPVEDDALAVHRVAVAALRHGEVAAAHADVVGVHEGVRDPRAVRVQREAVGGDRGRALLVAPPERAPVTGHRCDPRQLDASQRTGGAAQRPAAPDPHLLVQRHAARHVADRAAERERAVASPRQRSRAPGRADDESPAGGRAPREDGAGTRLVGRRLSRRRPDQSPLRERRPADDPAADRHELAVAAQPRRPGDVACDDPARARGEVGDDESSTVEECDLSGGGGGGGGGCPEHDRNEREYGYAHLASILPLHGDHGAPDRLGNRDQAGLYRG